VASIIDSAYASESDAPLPPSDITARPLHIEISWRKLLALAAVLLGPWLIIGVWLISASWSGAMGRLGALRFPTTASPATIDGKAGAWGNLRYTPLAIELPEEFVYVAPHDQAAIQWLFKGYDAQRVKAVFKSAGLSAAQQELAGKVPWKIDADGVTVTPSDELILSLSPETRTKVYNVLVEFSENNRHIDPIFFHADVLESQLADSGLTKTSIDLLRSLLYRNEGSSTWMFADVEPALRRLTDEDQRHRFVKLCSRKMTLLARLHVDGNSDIEALAAYWGVNGRRKDITPLLESMRRVEGGCGINIVCLLPQFARERLYNHPYTTMDPNATKQDCFWSAFNFFKDAPDDHFNDMSYVRRVLDAEYYNILEPSQLGDLILLSTRDKTVVHAAVYVADDIVFTKNGSAYTQPWILMHLRDMIDTYAVRYPTSGPLQPLYFRKKVL
jgi:hypothetical protein